MRKASIETAVERFYHWQDIHIEIMNKAVDDESPFSQQHKTEILEAFVFKMCAHWEILVEELMIACLNRDSQNYASYMNLRLPKHMPRAQCSAMIVGLGYLDFKSVSDIKKKAKNILVNDFNPFQAIGNQDAKKINQFYQIRNYLAHYSTPAERSLKKMYEDTFRLKKFRQPGHFLLSSDKTLKKPRMQIYVNAFISAVDSMAEKLGLEFRVDVPN